MMQNTALLVIDVQNAMLDQPVHNGEQLLSNIGRLVAQARASDTPVIFVQHNTSAKCPMAPGAPGWQIHPSLASSAGDVIVQKWHPDAFQETQLQEELSKRSVNRLVVTGLQTEYCIDTTCRRAYSLGYDVTLVQDAHSTFDTERLPAAKIIDHHNAVLSDWFARLQPAADVFAVHPVE
jgi:nicotinamidase-related amidase